jgi:DNA-binding HxlR family transcriptional regulator
VAGKRSYGDPCGVARALDVIGERWALLVVRELLFGPKRFTDLRAGLAGASQNVLSQRLHELAEAGVVRRRRLGPPVSAPVYELTACGQELEPVLIGLARWGSRMALTSAADLNVDALMLALKTTFDPQLAGTLRARVELRLGDDRFRASVAGGRFELARGEADSPDVVIDTDPATLRSLVFRGRRIADAERAGTLALAGDGEKAAAFLGLFPRPEPG